MLVSADRLFPAGVSIPGRAVRLEGGTAHGAQFEQRRRDMFKHPQRFAALAALVALPGLLLASPGPPADATRPGTAAARPGTAAFDRFKALSGEWIAAEDAEMVKKGDLVARYAVTAAGSAVVETIFPGTEHEMVTVYHADGPDLVLTHFCMEGNQPRMRAKGARGPRIDFAFDGGTNIDPARDRHMHSATFEFVGANEIRSEWSELAEGKPVFVARTHLLRKAR
jgi:hypothetical protein